MNCTDGAADPCCSNNNAAVVPATSGETSGMVPDYSIDELFELVWKQEEGQAGGTGSMQPAVSCLWSPRFSSKPPDVLLDPPSEDEMAAWLSAIVKGEEELACNNDNDKDGGGRRPMADDGRQDYVVAPAMGITATTTTDKIEKVATTEVTKEMGNNEIRKVPAGGSSSSRRSHHGEAHNLTEKRRRHKINERLRTLQQLVPGCSKSNQASTLDQTIHYMKSLQHQVQAMSVGLGAASSAVYPVVQPRCVPPGTPVAMPFPAAHPMVLGGHPPLTMVPCFGTTMLQLPHYPGAAMTMVPAAMAPLHPAAAPPSTAVAPGDAMSANRLRGSSSGEGKGKANSSLSQSDRT